MTAMEPVVFGFGLVCPNLFGSAWTLVGRMASAPLSPPSSALTILAGIARHDVTKNSWISKLNIILSYRSCFPCDRTDLHECETKTRPFHHHHGYQGFPALRLNNLSHLLFTPYITLSRMNIYFTLLLASTIWLSRAEDEKLMRRLDEKVAQSVVAPWPLGPKPSQTRNSRKLLLDEEIMVTGENCDGARPFFYPSEPEIDIYTVTETVTSFSTITTSRIINLGTTTTLTRSLTLTSTKLLTSTVLDVSVKTTTTTVSLSQTVFGGTVTRTTVIDTTVVSTLFITPIAATSESVLTRVSRITKTVVVLATRTTETFSIETISESQTISFISVSFEFTSTSTVTVPSFIFSLVTQTISLYGFSFSVTPSGWGITSSTPQIAVTVPATNILITQVVNAVFSFERTITNSVTVSDSSLTVTPTFGPNVTNLYFSTSTIN